MARMSREFSLVLLGAGILTAGYFLWPEDDLQARAEQQAVQQVAGQGGHRYHGHPIVFLHGGRVGGPSPAKASLPRGGFGSIGKSVSGVS